MELRLDTTRGDELGDLEGVGDGGGRHTSKRMGLAWPNRPSVSNRI